MDLGLQQRRVLVTGSTGGIGFAIAKEFAKEGAQVWLNGRSHERVDQAIQRLKDVGVASVKGIACDLGTVEGAEMVFQQLPEVDVLVNNLGIFEPQAFFDITDEDWYRFIEINIMSGVRLSRYYLKGMLERDAGRIQFIASESGANTPTEMIHYGMTKSSQIFIARGLAELTKGSNVTVNSILPGPTLTEGVIEFVREVDGGRHGTDAEAQASFIKENRNDSLIQRFIKPEEVASMSVYAASERASATNGASLRVEGGLLRHMG